MQLLAVVDNSGVFCSTTSSLVQYVWVSYDLVRLCLAFGVFVWYEMTGLLLSVCCYLCIL